MKKTDYLILVLTCTYILLLPILSPAKSEWAMMSIFVLIAFIYFLELIFREEVRKEFKGNFKKIMVDSFTIIFIVLILIMLLSTVYAKDKFISLKITARFVYYALIYFVIRFRFNKEQFFSAAIKVYMFSASIVGIIGLKEFYKNFNPHQNLMEILNLSRVRSTIDHPNSFGAYIILVVFPAMVIAMRSRGSKRVIYSLMSLMFVFGAVTSFSRNAWLALAAGIVLLAALYNWRFLILSVIPVGVVLVIPEIISRLSHFFDAGINSSRIKLLKVAKMVIRDNFLQGVGNGNFTVVYRDYIKRFPELQVTEAETLPPHNTYIRMFTELGVIGAVIFIAFGVAIVSKLYMINKKLTGFLKDFYDGFLVSAVCFFLMCAFDDMFFVPKVTTYLIIFVAMACSLDTIVGKNKAIQ